MTAWVGLSGAWLAGAGTPVPVPPPAGPGAMHADAPPPGHTGGFGEPTCQACHSEYGVNVPGGGLTVEGIPRGWEPGRRYLLSVVLRSEEMGAAGFQVAIRTPDGLAAGTLEPLDDRVAVDSVADPAGPLVYARHTRAGTAVDDPSVALWQLFWTAPPGGAGVSIHAAANSANGDNSPFGDLVYTASSTVPSLASHR